MKALRWRTVAASAVALAAALPAAAQQREPHVGYVYPAGGQQGRTFEVTVGGQYLDGVSEVEVSGRGMTVEVGRHIKALTQQQANGLRNNFEKMTQLAGMGKTNAAMAKEAEQLRKRIEETLRQAGIDEMSMRAFQEYRKKANDPKKQLNPAISETVALTVTVAPGAPLGDREIRLRTSLGLTNPLKFQVGRVAEVSEKEPNDRAPEKAIEVAHPFVLNGQVTPGDLDKFRFRAKKGERLVVAAAARSLVPYLADAVPGWFQATLSLRNAKGDEVAYADDNRFDPDPVIACTIPEDGDYVIEIKDSIFRGREDFVYRVTVGEVPYLSGVFPLGGRAGVQTTIDVMGWNLPKKNLTLTPDGPTPGALPIAVDKGDRISNFVPFAIDTLPECLETESNDDLRTAQKVEFPMVINGRIGRAGDRDLFRFEGRGGETMVVEVTARRLHSPLDSIVRVFDATGKQLAFNDDFDDKGAGLITHQADSRVECVLPASGAYIVSVSDTQGKGDETYAYRCRISPRRPSFDLRVVPSSINLRAGAAAPLTVFAFRRDGFDGEIAVELQDAPKGFVLAGGRIPKGEDKVRLTLLPPPEGTNHAVRLKMQGVATILGREVRRPAVPSDDMMQAFFYRHLVPAETLLANVVSRGFRPPPPPRILADGPVRIPAGGTAPVRVLVPGRTFVKNIQIELNEPPEGLTIEKVNWSEQNAEILLKADGDKAKAGIRGNLIVDLLGDGSAFRPKDAKPPQGGGGRKIPLGVLPAIPFEVVAR
ncbi:MAG: hypothetical protein FJ221_02695 [Lentisphaerae bacterium]|nr:hypothetical protein [Lentisphaerota bacterium]